MTFFGLEFGIRVCEQLLRTEKTQQQRPFALENLVGVLNDQSVGHDQVAHQFNAHQIFQFISRFGVLAKDRISRGGGTGNSCPAMDEKVMPIRQDTRKL